MHLDLPGVKLAQKQPDRHHGSHSGDRNGRDQAHIDTDTGDRDDQPGQHGNQLTKYIRPFHRAIDLEMNQLYVPIA